MRYKSLVLVLFLLALAVFNQADAKTKCVWIIHSKDGTVDQKIGISLPLAKLCGETKGTFDINGIKIAYQSLQLAAQDGSVLQIKDSAGNGETKIYRGTFDREMKEKSEKHNRLFMEDSERGKEPEVSQFRVKSIEAAGTLLAMIGLNNFENDMDKIESALEQGGVFYTWSNENDSQLWIYVN
jgi:hypothetical protein